VLLPQVIWRYLKILATTEGLPFFNAVFELVSTVFAITLLYTAWLKKYKLDWLTFSALAVLIPTLSGTLASMPRYIIVAFPIYIALAQIKNVAAKIAIVLIFALMLAASAVLFTQGYWVA